MAISQSRMTESGSNYNFGDKILTPNLKRSVLDTSYKNIFTGTIGPLYPFYLQFCMPNEDYTINTRSLIRVVNTPRVPLASGLKVFISFYYSSFYSLWKNAHVFFSKYGTGEVIGRTPFFRTADFSQASAYFTKGQLNNYLARGSLFDFLIGSPPKTFLSEQDSTATQEFEFPAMPFLMYQKIWRDYFLNKNLNYANDDYGKLFPYDDSDFRFDGTITDIYDLHGIPGSVRDALRAPVDINTRTWWTNLWRLRWSNFADDYFTTARLEPQRGDQPTLDFMLSFNSLNVGINPSGTNFIPLSLYGSFTSDLSGDVIGFSQNSNLLGYSATDGSQFVINNSEGTSRVGNIFGGEILGGASNTKRVAPDSTSLVVSPKQTASSTISASLLRGLMSASVIAEKSNRTDGTYLEWVRTFFNQKPSSAFDFKPVYIGGDWQPIVFTEVLQQTPTTGTISQPLGHIGGKGISSGSGFIGKFHCSDFGYIMGILRVVPETYYDQARYKPLWYETQEDFPLPERYELGMQPILNKELFWSGERDVDNDVYGYQDRLDELRYRMNEVHGKHADPDSESFFPYTMVRHFESTPTLTNSFVTMNSTNVNKSFVTSYDEDIFSIQVITDVRLVSTLPYRTVPSGLLGARI